jgi:hypothetical protein
LLDPSDVSRVDVPGLDACSQHSVDANDVCLPPSFQPELGNMMFGNSRGTCPVDRGLQNQFGELLQRLGFDYYGSYEDEPAESWSNAPVWGKTNGDITVRTYWWGECRCGWDDKEYAGEHDPNCYQTRLDDLRRRFGGRKDAWGHSQPRDYKPYDNARTVLCKELGLDERHGCEVHCTCTYESRLEAWFHANKLGEDGHDPMCPIVLPNFEVKSLGFSLKWYKYPLRDSYSNIPFTLELLNRIGTAERAAADKQLTGGNQ